MGKLPRGQVFAEGSFPFVFRYKAFYLQFYKTAGKRHL